MHDLENIDRMLQQWAMKVAGSIRQDLGYKSTTIEYRLKREGMMIKQDFKTRGMDNWPAEVEMVEEAVCRMSAFYKRIIKVKYLMRGSDTEKAKYLKMSRAWFQNCSNVAKGIVAGYLDAVMKEGAE